MNDHDMNLALDTMLGLIGDRKVTYLVTPLNGGPRFIEHLRSHGTAVHTDMDRVVVRPNRVVAQREAARLRRSTGRTVFDPTCFGVYDGWNQHDYVALCLQILAARADEVVFADGWQFSAGCIEEYGAVAASDLPMFDSQLRELTRDVGWQMVASAVEIAADLGWDLPRGRPVRSVA